MSGVGDVDDDTTAAATLSREQELEHENRQLREQLATLREHTLDSNPALRALHSNAVAYLDAVSALAEVRGGAPLSTTIGWLIRQRLLVSVDEVRS